MHVLENHLPDTPLHALQNLAAYLVPSEVYHDDINTLQVTTSNILLTFSGVHLWPIKTPLYLSLFIQSNTVGQVNTFLLKYCYKLKHKMALYLSQEQITSLQQTLANSVKPHGLDARQSSMGSSDGSSTGRSGAVTPVASSTAREVSPKWDIPSQMEELKQVRNYFSVCNILVLQVLITLKKLLCDDWSDIFCKEKIHPRIHF